jgi:hypothetical protein
MVVAVSEKRYGCYAHMSDHNDYNEDPEAFLTLLSTGADPGFSSKSTPTSPNYWPFRLHLRSRCSLTRSSYGGVAGHKCLQPREISSGSNTRTIQHAYITYQLRSIPYIYQIYHNNAITVYQGKITQHQSHTQDRYTWFTLSLGLRPQNCAL